MTTPNQAAPDGAYIVGGGHNHFGQTVSESFTRAAFEYPMPTFDNMLEMLETVLNQLPLGALEPFKDFLGLDDSLFATVAQAVQAIMDSLLERPIYMALQDLIFAITGSNVVQTAEELAEWIQENIIGAIADLASKIIDFVTQSQLVQAIAKATADIVGAITGGVASTVEDLARWFQDNVMNILVTLAEGIQGIADQIIDFVTKNELTQLIVSLIKAITGGAVDTIADLAVWFQQNVMTRIAELTTQVADLIRDLVNYVTNSQLATALNKLTSDIVKAITGVAGTLGDLTTWFTANVTGAISSVLTKLQELIDSIVRLLTPGAGAGNPVSSAISVIQSILGIATNADTSSAQNAAAIQGILAGQAGGFTETFDYAVSNDLQAVSGGKWQRMNGAINDRYGTDGAGNAIGVMDGALSGLVWYANGAQPLTTPDMQVTAVLSRLPWWTLTNKSSWSLMVQAGHAMIDRSCLGVEILNNQARFFSQNSAGTQTDIGSKINIPENAVGIPYTLQIKGNVMTLIRNNITVASVSGVTPLSGRCVGFGGLKVSYINPVDNPLAHFAGISWQPAA